MIEVTIFLLIIILFFVIPKIRYHMNISQKYGVIFKSNFSATPQNSKIIKEFPGILIAREDIFTTMRYNLIILNTGICIQSKWENIDIFLPYNKISATQTIKHPYIPLTQGIVIIHSSDIFTKPIFIYTELMKPILIKSTIDIQLKDVT